LKAICMPAGYVPDHADLGAADRLDALSAQPTPARTFAGLSDPDAKPVAAGRLGGGLAGETVADAGSRGDGPGDHGGDEGRRHRSG
jgi:hypothetical protein